MLMLRSCVGAVVAGLALIAAATSVDAANADPPGGNDGGIVVTPNPGGPGVGIGVTDPGSPGGSDDSGGTKGNDSGDQSNANPCVKDPTSQACQDWASQNGCNANGGAVPVGTCLPADPLLQTNRQQVSPAELAQTAYGELRLPAPMVHRSPDESNSDPAQGGLPYTWVNLWTWYWTAPSEWHDLSKTETAGAVWATAVARPTALLIDPGDGSEQVRCAGPGRPWQRADGENPPASGGCGYEYRHVTAAGPLTATVFIEWSVSWSGSGGAAGTFLPMETQTRLRFVVEQIQALNR